MKINHVLVLAQDIKKMTSFWTSILGLTNGYRPPFPFAGAWLYSEKQPLIHVAQVDEVVDKNGAISHVALEGDNYPNLISNLRDYAVNYAERDVPLTGERQVFVQGPDGLTVEMIYPLDTVEALEQPYNDTGIKQVQMH